MEVLVSKVLRIFKKKYFVIVFVFSSVIALLGLTYSFWSNESGWELASEIKFKNLEYILKINDNVIDYIDVDEYSGTAYYDMEITSLNELNTRYLLAYKGNENVSVALSSESINKPEGIIGLYSNALNSDKIKTIRVAITNDTDTRYRMYFKIYSGYTWNSQSSISKDNDYNYITKINYEIPISGGLLLTEETNKLLNCTPSATSPCLYIENASNYLSYSDHLWRIMGTYVFNGVSYTKLVLDELLPEGTTYSASSTILTNFYNSLSDKSAIKTSMPFACTGSLGTFSCNTYANRGLISKSEYDLIGGVNSYLYTKPNKNYWFNTSSGSSQYYVGTSRGISTQSSNTSAFSRPSIYLKTNVVETAKAKSSFTMTNLVTNGSFEGGVTSWVKGVANDYMQINTNLSYVSTGIKSAQRQIITTQNYYTQDIDLDLQHKYYFSLKAYNTSNNIFYVDISPYGSGALTGSTITINSSNVFNKYSSIFEVNKSSSNYILYLGYGPVGSNSLSGAFYMDDVLLVDLTETFGVGKEPTKEWCDENLDYFDGTTTKMIKNGDFGTKENPYQVAEGYKLTLNMNGGTCNLVNNGYYAKNTSYPIESLNKSYYTFNGWTVSGTGTSATNNLFTIGTSAVTLTANWTPIPYTITYNLNGGTNNANNPSTYNIESDDITLAAPTKYGYDFTGWTGSNGSTLQASVVIPSGTVANLSYTANWKKTLSSITASIKSGFSNVYSISTQNSSTTFNKNSITVTAYFIGGGVTTAASLSSSDFSVTNTTINWSTKIITISYTYEGVTKTTTFPIIVQTTITIYPTSFNTVWKNYSGTSYTNVMQVGSNTAGATSTTYTNKIPKSTILKYNFSSYSGYTIREAVLRLENISFVTNSAVTTESSATLSVLRNVDISDTSVTWQSKPLSVESASSGTQVIYPNTTSASIVVTNDIQPLVDMEDTGSYGLTIAAETIAGDSDIRNSHYQISEAPLSITYSNESRDTLTRIPSSALTSSSTLATASTRYSTSYLPYAAFDRNNSYDGGCWASLATDNVSPWIQLNMENRYKNIIVDVTNRMKIDSTYTDLHGPINFSVSLSNDGTTWTNSVSVTGCPGSINSFITGNTTGCMVSLGNTTAYQYVRVTFSDWAGKTASNPFVSVGEIRVWGTLSN